MAVSWSNSSSSFVYLSTAEESNSQSLNWQTESLWIKHIDSQSESSEPWGGDTALGDLLLTPGVFSHDTVVAPLPSPDLLPAGGRGTARQVLPRAALYLALCSRCTHTAPHPPLPPHTCPQTLPRGESSSLPSDPHLGRGVTYSRLGEGVWK